MSEKEAREASQMEANLAMEEGTVTPLAALKSLSLSIK